MAWLLYGQRADGELLHISEAARGDDCACFCPHCQTPLAAKKGKIKIHHFAHLGSTCAYVSAYDFLHVEHFVDTTLSLTQWVAWKQQDMEQTGIRLQAEYEQFSQEMVRLRKVIDEAREELVEVSQPHPTRKQRSKVRQANFEVLQQWDAYLADHNVPGPDLQRVRDIASTQYRAFYYVHEGRWVGRHTTGLSAWPNELWYPEHKERDWIPVWLVDGGLALLNDYQPLRRKLATAELHLNAFHAEKSRFERFRLYFLLIEFASRPPLFKIGITSRADLTERMAEIRSDMHSYGVVDITCLAELPGYAFLESYFKHKYAPQQQKLGKLTEYFAFDEEQFDAILRELQSLAPLTATGPTNRRNRIKAGMAQARGQGVHVGRPQGSEADERFLQKPKSKQVVDLIRQHSDWSLREVSRYSGVAINTVCKVARLLEDPGGYFDPLPGQPEDELVAPIRPAAIPFRREYNNETDQRRKHVVEQLQQADDYLVITVSKRINLVASR